MPSTEAPFANLPSAVRELVVESSSGRRLGESDEEKKEIASWIVKASDGSFVSRSSLPRLNTELTPKTYLVGNDITAADVALYGSLHPIMSVLQPIEYYSTPALTRYFDHIQHDPNVRSCSSALALVDFDIANAPKQERKAEAPIKKKKKDEAAAGPSSDNAATAAATSSQKQKAPAQAGITEEQAEQADRDPAAGKKEKKERGKKEAGTAAAASGGKKGESSKGNPSGGGAAAADSGDPLPSMIELRVGHIVDIKVHPDADGLYVEQIDLGEETGPRTVISGLVNYIPIERMQDRYIVAVCNLKPVNMRGIKSHAMVLCATSKDGKDAGIELVEPPPGTTAGERIYFEGFEDKEPLAQLNPKKKIFETIQPGFTTLETHEAAWVDPVAKTAHRIRTKEGVCRAPTFVGASLS